MKGRPKFLEKNFEKYKKRKMSLHDFLCICSYHKETNELFSNKEILKYFFQVESFDELHDRMRRRGRDAVFFETFYDSLSSEDRLEEKIAFCKKNLEKIDNIQDLYLFLDDARATNFFVQHCFSEFLASMTNSAYVDTPFFELFLDIWNKNEAYTRKNRIKDVSEVCEKMTSLHQFLRFCDLTIGVECFKTFSYSFEAYRKFQDLAETHLEKLDAESNVSNLSVLLKTHNESLVVYSRIYEHMLVEFNRHTTEFLELVRSSERARNSILEIFKNNLEYQYSNFEQLRAVLVKDDTKKKLKLNF